MTTKSKTCAVRSQLDALVETLPDNVSIEQAVEAALESCAIDRAYRSRALRRQLAQDLRREFNKPRGPDGLPRRMSVPGSDGRRGYRQVELFDREQFVVAWHDADRREHRAAVVKAGLESAYARKYDEDLQTCLPFDD